jgi:hypothetical protein
MSGVSGRPGDGCSDPRALHDHWCGFCGAVKTFSAAERQQLIAVPQCLRCGSLDWRDEINELTAPDFREDERRG